MSERGKAPESAQLWLPNIVSSELPEFATSLTPEGSEVYFNRTSTDRTTIQIMNSKFQAGEWTNPVSLPFSTGQYLDVDPFVSPNGDRLYFSSTRPIDSNSSEENWDTWYVDRIDGGWTAPVNAGVPLNSDSTEIFITVAKNGNAYFVTERDGDRGIVVSRFKNGAYQPVEKVRPTLRGQSIYASNPCIASDESFSNRGNPRSRRKSKTRPFHYIE